ncbi:hypothetical protein [Limnobacter sp.]|uniref:hypothetical protein n=1 Tax=Limnobacter sp. TaxID=2003368 RepID=UPI002E323A2F|nr:hypothetical protein [Limnobacter sp.]
MSRHHLLPWQVFLPGLLVLAWGMRNALASSHRLPDGNRPALRTSREDLPEVGRMQ